MNSEHGTAGFYTFLMPKVLTISTAVFYVHIFIHLLPNYIYFKKIQLF